MLHFKYKDYSFYCDIGMMTPLQYIRMINILEEYEPKRICELGSGQSTDIINVYVQKTNARAYSIEHDKYWNTHNSVMMPLVENTQLNVNNHIYNKCSIYQGLEEWLGKKSKFDFVLIDAPNDGIPNNNQGLEYARIQMVDFILMNKLSDKSIVMYHDSERNIAQNTLNEFEHLLNEYGYAYQKEIIIEKDKEIFDYNKKILGDCPQLTIYKITKIT